MSIRILLNPAVPLVQYDYSLHKVLAGETACPCLRTVSASVILDVTDTTGVCLFHEHKEETLVSSELVDLCGPTGWGPFDFEYPEFLVGAIFINSLAVGVCGTPDNLCFFTDGICGGLYGDDGHGHTCGSGEACFNFGDTWDVGDNPNFPNCESTTKHFHWILNDGTPNFVIDMKLNITAS